MRSGGGFKPPFFISEGVMRERIEVLKKFVAQREKFPNGFYVSTVLGNITVGISYWRGEVTTSYYLSLRKSDEVLKRLKVSGVNFSLESEKDETGRVVGEYYLVVEECKGVVFSREILERFRELKERLEEFPYRSDWGRKFLSRYPEEYSGLKGWSQKLVSLAGKIPIKILVYLDRYAEFTFEANSIFGEGEKPPLKVFAGLRRRLSREFSLSDSSVMLSYPSIAFPEEQNGIRIVYPLCFADYDTAMKELRRARVEVVPQSDDLAIEF